MIGGVINIVFGLVVAVALVALVLGIGLAGALTRCWCIRSVVSYSRPRKWAYIEVTNNPGNSVRVAEKLQRRGLEIR